jgi:hypothetical protein
MKKREKLRLEIAIEKIRHIATSELKNVAGGSSEYVCSLETCGDCRPL